ncbi:MarR family transcriptional regulator [Halopseudomonas laoshanensis]|uniref:MarR family transcriptional regulator n=1 Tax=Halopseudomonas laoshanensis TaxID=2268758 RepID=A0A7V7KV41_9GAMM|nr:MarR family transcriptional regulator [Halopseudomonas laoshanensis]KAA0694575.1 MarR family transcriptional regulator [Halopseudomonas laoshanensis]
MSQPPSSPSTATDPSMQLLLRNQLCHSLYSASNAMVRAYRPLLEPLGLTYPQYLVMLALWEHDGVPIKQLVEDTRLDSGTLTPILKRLEQKELVRRRKGVEDERQWLIDLSVAGLSLREQASDIPLKLFCMTSLTLEQAQALKVAAEQIYQDVLRQAPSSDSINQ